MFHSLSMSACNARAESAAIYRLLLTLHGFLRRRRAEPSCTLKPANLIALVVALLLGDGRHAALLIMTIAELALNAAAEEAVLISIAIFLIMDGGIMDIIARQTDSAIIARVYALLPAEGLLHHAITSQAIPAIIQMGVLTAAAAARPPARHALNAAAEPIVAVQ